MRITNELYRRTWKCLHRLRLGVNDACISANAAEPWRCIFAQYTLPHIKTPFFVAEGAYDSWQLGNLLQLPCRTCAEDGKADCCGNSTFTAAFLEYGTTMKSTIKTALATPPSTVGPASRGAFVSACIVHCQTVFNEGEDRWDAWQVGGRKPREVFHSFYFGDGGSTMAIDPLIYPQNPSCPVWT